MIVLVSILNVLIEVFSSSGELKFKPQHPKKHSHVFLCMSLVHKILIEYPLTWFWQSSARLLSCLATSGWSFPNAFSRISRARLHKGSASRYLPLLPYSTYHGYRHEQLFVSVNAFLKLKSFLQLKFISSIHKYIFKSSNSQLDCWEWQPQQGGSLQEFSF